MDAVTFTAQKMNIPEIYIEKDYWVTFALYTIFNNEIGKETIFKGGTALSKCFGLINRFSEDIDLVMVRREGESKNQLKNKIGKISELLYTALPEVNDADITRKFGMIRKTAHFYPKMFQHDYGQARDVIVVEATWFGHYEPFQTMPLVSYIGDMMIQNGQTNIAEDNGLMPFEVSVLKPERTICEKIMSLVRFSYSDQPIDELKMKIRHIYDLHQLLKNPALLKYFNSLAFEEMLLRVANDDVESFANNNQWLIHHPQKSVLFQKLESTWEKLTPTYNGSFKKLVFGDLPNEAEVFETLNQIKERLSLIEWSIKIGK